MKCSKKSLPNLLAEGCERGQILVIGLIVSVALVMASVTVANVGMMVAEKIHAQDTVDAAAYSAAVVEARYMNLSAYINRAMIANYNSMAFNTALWATTDAYDHGMAVVTDLLYKVSEVLALFVITASLAQVVDQVADITEAVHSPLHSVNSLLNDAFAQDELDLNQYLEVYNVYALTMYQGLLYASLQSDRFRIVREVAEQMDPELITTTTLGLGAEALSYDELAQAVDWVIRDTDARSGVFNEFNRAFDSMAGVDDDESEHPRLLAAVTEASLDKFVVGRDRRGVPDILRQFNTASLLGGIGAGLSIDVRLGASVRDRQENRAFQNHVPFITRQRMREVSFFGVDFVIDSDNILLTLVVDALQAIGIPTAFGHTSGDKKNDVANAANATFSVLGGIDFVRAFECMLTGTGCMIGASTPTGGLNALNILASTTMLPTGLVGPPLIVDDHWDGTYDAEPVASHQIFDPVSGKVDPVQYIGSVIGNGVEKGVPKYDWIVDLDNVGFPHFHYPTEGAQQRPDNSTNVGSLIGPSVAVVGVKRARDINGLRGLGIGLEEPNDYPITTIARAQVYYLRNPNRPDESPSMFNPHWVARLAPIDSEDTPALLGEVLPFVSSLGAPITPTH